jgi:DNA polymerase-4
MERKIIHVDMDCFYAQVEMRDRPELRNIPLAIGGPPGTRSVLCTSNYLARTFGVKSAMPSDYAVRLCPKLVIIPPNFKKYQAASEIIQAIFWKYSDNVESVSLDEAYIDVSHYPNATTIGKIIKEEIFKATGLTASVGVAPNKFLAKIASDWKKPNGLFVIPPWEVQKFINDLPVKLIPGVGKKGLEQLERLGIKTCTDLRKTAPEILALTFGKFSMDLYDYAHGIDTRIVQSDWERKSLSVETTFLKDMTDSTLLSYELEELLLEMRDRITRHLESEPHKKIKKIFVKVKFSDFKQLSSEESLIPFDLTNCSIEERLPVESFIKLMNTTMAKKTCAVRLIGVGVRFLTPEDYDPVQLSFLPLCG